MARIWLRYSQNTTVLCQGYGGNIAEMAEISVRFGQDMHKIWL